MAAVANRHLPSVIRSAALAEAGGVNAIGHSVLPSWEQQCSACRSELRFAAIDRIIGAGDEARLARQQEGGDGGGLIRFAQASHGVALHGMRNDDVQHLLAYPFDCPRQTYGAFGWKNCKLRATYLGNL